MKTKIALSTGLFLLGCLIMAGSATTAQAQTLYSQNFTNTYGSSQGVYRDGWSGYIGAGALNVSTSGNNATYTGASAVTLGNAAGNPNTSIGFLSFYNQGAAAGAQSFSAVVTGLNLALTSGVSTITWQMNTSSVTSQTLKMLVQVDGAWYISNSGFTQTALSATTFDTASTGSFVFNTLASTWSTFTLTPSLDNTGTMAIGSALGADLGSSTITGLGFYSEISTRYNSIRIDSLEVNAVPEPTTLALLMGGCGLMAVIRRPRKASLLDQ